jgi:hypothetical protein
LSIERVVAPSLKTRSIAGAVKTGLRFGIGLAEEVLGGIERMTKDFIATSRPA